jgi:NAD(P)-dependent dehydrogenase (short-subunit alcohol dehydrogenase family)
MRALVTGAARGIGAVITERLRADGMEVVTLDRAPGCDLQIDLRTDDLPELADIDVCVANAAITNTISPAHRMSAEMWQRDIDVNLTGAFRTIQACLPGMRERGYGRIVGVTSVAWQAGLPGQVAYGASKAGVIGLIRTIAAENVAKGITANAIEPGMVGTEVVRSMPPEILERAIAIFCPRGTLVEPAEIADAVGFLCSSAASGITGQVLGVDGGARLNTNALAG